MCNLLSNKDKFEGTLAEGLKYTALKLSTVLASLWNEDPNLVDQDSGDLKDMMAHVICVVQANAFTVRFTNCLNLIFRLKIIERFLILSIKEQTAFAKNSKDQIRITFVKSTGWQFFWTPASPV